MEFWLSVFGGVVLLFFLCLDKKNKGNEQEKYRRSDLVIGQEQNETGDNYCVYCCSRGFEIVFQGNWEECHEFINNQSY